MVLYCSNQFIHFRLGIDSSQSSLRPSAFLLLLFYWRHLLIVILFLALLQVSPWFVHVVLVLTLHLVHLCSRLLMNSCVLLRVVLSSAVIALQFLWGFLFVLPCVVHSTFCWQAYLSRRCWLSNCRSTTSSVYPCDFLGRAVCWRHWSRVLYWAPDAFCSDSCFCSCNFFASVPFFLSRCAYHSI